MKTRPPLVRELRSLFGFIRWLMILWLIALPIAFMGDWKSSSQNWKSHYGSVDFNPDIAAFHADVGPQPKAADGIRLRALTGTVLVSTHAEGGKLIAATRVPVLVNRLTRVLILFAIAHLLWRLCQAVERGEVFSLGNSRLVRWLGVALVVRPIIGLVFETWQRASVARYLEDHVRFDGLRSIVTANDLAWWERAIDNAVRYGDFDFTLFTTGLLVLVLAEVFRRGLALKQENDLTV